MPKSGVLVAIALVLSACVNTMPQTFVGVAPGAPADAYSCVLSELAHAEYGVLDGERDAGFIRAERRRRDDFSEFLTGDRYYDVINVTLSEDGEGTRIQAIASSQVESGGDRRSSRVHDRAKEMAARIVDSCGA